MSVEFYGTSTWAGILPIQDALINNGWSVTIHGDSSTCHLRALRGVWLLELVDNAEESEQRLANRADGKSVTLTSPNDLMRLAAKDSEQLEWVMEKRLARAAKIAKEAGE